MAAEGNDAPFSISIEGEVTGEKWTGDFSAKKRLSHRDALRKDQVRRELLGAQPGEPSDRALSIAVILSELSVRLTRTPRWWSEKNGGLDLDDENVLAEVYQKAIDIEVQDAKQRKEKAEEAIKEMRASVGSDNNK